jgi:Secretion system C-terminal sorting domain
MKKITVLIIMIISTCFNGLNLTAQTVDIGIFKVPVGSNNLEIRLRPSSIAIPASTYDESVFTIRTLTTNSPIFNITTNPYMHAYIVNPAGEEIDGLYSYYRFQFSSSGNSITLAASQEVPIVTIQYTSAATDPVFELVTSVTPLDWPGLYNGSYYQVLNGIDASGIIYRTSTDLSVLPVELLSFKADKKGNKSAIKWETVNEKNIELFIVERSDDGSNFRQLGYKNPKGANFDKKENYEYFDDTPNMGINYYRLQSKGMGKEVKYSKVVSLDFGLGLKGKAYPNPFVAALSVEIDIEQGVKGEVIIDVFDTSGKQVLTKKINAEGRKLNFDLPTEGLIAGNYVLRVKNGASTWRHTITKQ